MIDRKTMEKELHQARLARLVEELIWEVQHIRLGRQRVVFSVAGFEQDWALAG